MEIIPGIDLMRGECVCPVHRPFADQVGFSHDPVGVAELWAREGARRLFIADLDGARMGEPRNLAAVRRIIETAKIPVYLGGGVRTLDTAKRVLDLGVARVVVGTAAALDARRAEEIFGNLADRTILSVASLNGYVAVRDWQARTDERADVFAKRMIDLGAKRVVFTDVSRKGMRGGVNSVAIARMARTLDVPVIASGGISSMDDLKEIKALEPLGVEGVVVVTAIYSGAVRLCDAIDACL